MNETWSFVELKRICLIWCDLGWWWRRNLKKHRSGEATFRQTLHSPSPPTFCGFAHDLKSIVHIQEFFEDCFPPHCWSFLRCFFLRFRHDFTRDLVQSLQSVSTKFPILAKFPRKMLHQLWDVQVSYCQVHHLLGFLPLPWWRHRSAFLGRGGRKLWDVQRKSEF